MIIVLEGPDLAGKTTIAEHLLTHFGERQGKNAQYIKVSQPDTDNGSALFAEYVSQVYMACSKIADGEVDVVIFDRLHIGEWVYGPRKRANSKLSWHQIVAIDDMLDGVKALKLFVNQPDNLLLQRYDVRGEEFVSKNELIDIAGHYRQLLDPYSSEAADSHELGLHRWHSIRRTNDIGELL